MGIKILVTGSLNEEGLAHLKKGKSFNVEYAPGLKGEALHAAIRDTSAMIIRTETPITRELLGHAHRLEIICRAGVGIDHIDMAACAERQIVVMNTPGANRISTAEHTIALLLAVSRSIPQATAALKSGRWDRDHFTGCEISQKTLGIVGLGNIGQRVATRAKIFGMDVVAHDPYLDPSIAGAVNVTLLPLEKVLSSSHYISLHVPLTDETDQMAGDGFFEKMREGSFFINTSRGRVVNETSLLKALERKHLRGAALDVFEHEPIAPENPLLKLDNVIVTPHIAGQTVESQFAMSMDAAQQVREFFEEGTVVNPVLKF